MRLILLVSFVFIAQHSFHNFVLGGFGTNTKYVFVSPNGSDGHTG